jgi:(1->4)-alpha-D-glucan 1-alpha-D-glucosylmutase
VTLEEVLERLARQPDGLVRVPLATYRLQLGPDLTFDDAAQVVSYLAALGVSDAYTSPFFENASGSAHGYDVADHHRFRDALGGEAAFQRFADALRRHGLGLLIDVVPNHMGIARNRNAWWADVLEHGAASPYAAFFDIDWAPVKPELANKVLLPILGDHYGAVLDSGQLRLEFADGVFTVRYHDTVLPVAPRTYVQLLRHRLPELERVLGSAHPDLLALKRVHDQFLTLPHRTETEPARLAARQREQQIATEAFRALLAASGDIRDFVEDNVRRFNGTPGEPASFDLLDGLLRDQVYRLAFWRVAGEEINYRRFFDINELAAIRMEDPRVFAETHRLVFRLVREGVVTGLRVDHPDGLYGPAEYFHRLQRACFLEVARRLVGADREPAAGDWRDRRALEGWDALNARWPGRQAFYIVAEKILAPGEPLPPAWAVAGTTGYEFLNLLNGIFVDRSQARALDETYRRLVRAAPVFSEIVYESKRLMMQTSMASEVAMLAHRLNIISEKHRSTRDSRVPDLRGRRPRPRAADRGRGLGGAGPHAARPGVHRPRRRPGQAAGGGHRRDGVRLDPRLPHAAPAGLGQRGRPPRAAGLGAAVPAADRAGDGQGLRGHRALPVRAAALAQRGGRRSGPLRHLAGRVPRRDGRPPARAPARAVGHLHPRHQAQ